jgi:site-specific recombinase XerC
LTATLGAQILKGKCGHALLAVMIGCGLRRAELLGEVTVESLVLRERRCVLADITGKGERSRSAAVPAGAKREIDAWVQASIPAAKAARFGEKDHRPAQCSKSSG